MKALSKDTFNLKGYVIANGLTNFIHDGYYTNAIELLAAYNHIPISVLHEFKSLGCKLIDSVIKDRPNVNKPECLKFVDLINRKRMHANFKDLMDNV